MARIVVEIPGERAYDVVVSAGQIDRLGAEMRAFDANQKALIITDTEQGFAVIHRDRSIVYILV